MGLQNLLINESEAAKTDALSAPIILGDFWKRMQGELCTVIGFVSYLENNLVLT